MRRCVAGRRRGLSLAARLLYHSTGLTFNRGEVANTRAAQAGRSAQGHHLSRYRGGRRRPRAGGPAGGRHDIEAAARRARCPVSGHGQGRGAGDVPVRIRRLAGGRGYRDRRVHRRLPVVGAARFRPPGHPLSAERTGAGAALAQVLSALVPQRRHLPGARRQPHPRRPRPRLRARLDGARARLPNPRRRPHRRPHALAGVPLVSFRAAAAPGGGPAFRRARRGIAFRVAEGAVIAAAYAALTVYLAPVSYGPYQLRFAEVLKPLVIWEPHLIPAFVIGNFLGNLTSPFVGPWELVWMPFANLVGGWAAWRVGRRLVSAAARVRSVADRDRRPGDAAGARRAAAGVQSAREPRLEHVRRPYSGSGGRRVCHGVA